MLSDQFFLDIAVFLGPDYFVVTVWVSIMSQHSDTAILTVPDIYNFTNFFPGMVGHAPKMCGLPVIVDKVNIFTWVLISVYPAP